MGPIENCPHDHKPLRRDSNCMCGKPLMLYIPPGEHVHPCPVHPEVVLHGVDQEEP